jgi:alkylation response protein AidB-like acyl-CoA dehydrogenase
MFQMMNEARIGVGMGAAMLGHAGYLAALDYARSGRRAGRPTPGTRARRCRSSSMPTCAACCWRRRPIRGRLWRSASTPRAWSTTAAATPTSGARPRPLLLDVLTPIAKSWPSQWCLEANSLAIQVHGGYGYTRDYPSSSTTATTA